MSDFTIRIEGLQQLEYALLNKTVRQARAAMRSALSDSGNFMRIAIALKAPSRTGFLARNMVTKTKLSTKEDEGTVSVGPSREAYYAQFLEFGSIHNQPPRPFISTIFNQNKEVMANYFAKRLREELEL
jgi:HK97 gp10 family phage protein